MEISVLRKSTLSTLSEEKMEEGSHPIKLTAATKPLKLFAFNLLLALIYIGIKDCQRKS
jgi:hypothetical protein